MNLRSLSKKLKDELKEKDIDIEIWNAGPIYASDFDDVLPIFQKLLDENEVEATIHVIWDEFDVEDGKIKNYDLQLTGLANFYLMLPNYWAAIPIHHLILQGEEYILDFVKRVISLKKGDIRLGELIRNPLKRFDMVYGIHGTLKD